MSDWKQIIYGLVRVPSAFLYGAPGDALGNPDGDATDELLSGWAVALSMESERGWTRVRTHYGYEGWIYGGQIRTISRLGLENRHALAVTLPFLDIRSEPRVQGRILETLPRNSFVTLAEEQPEEGWYLAETAGGNQGYVRPAALRERAEDDRFLLQGAENVGILSDLDRERIAAMGEEALRDGIVRSALAYTGVQYRWSGKSPAGIDCSGLAFISCLENGLLIYRDAKLPPEYPVHPIAKNALKKGDLIYFPGHVAVYLGNGKYLHATAYAPTPCVTVNSLRPEDPDFRADLAAEITACGSVF